MQMVITYSTYYFKAAEVERLLNHQELEPHFDLASLPVHVQLLDAFLRVCSDNWYTVKLLHLEL